jgi:RNA polymerase sigma factor (sigma-70 family)
MAGGEHTITRSRVSDSILPLLDTPSSLPENDLAGYVRDYFQAQEDGDGVASTRALDALCRAVAPEMARFCAYIAGPRVNALDATQETLLELCRRLETIRDPGAVRPWLYSVARNKVLAQRRWSWVRRWVPGASLDAEIDPTENPHRSFCLGRRAMMVEEVLEQLPEEHRTALVLHLLQGLSDSEVATCLGRKKTNVKSLIRRAKESFQKQAKKLGYDRELAETPPEEVDE